MGKFGFEPKFHGYQPRFLTRLEDMPALQIEIITKLGTSTLYFSIENKFVNNDLTFCKISNDICKIKFQLFFSAIQMELD